MSEEEETLRKEVYKNRSMLQTLYQKYDLLKSELMNIQSKLRERVPAPSKELAEVKERLTKLENMMTLYVDAIQKVITKPSAAEVLTEAEGELKEIAIWIDPTLESRDPYKERVRRKRSVPSAWQEAEEEHIVIQDRKQWQQALRRTRKPPTSEAGELENLSPSDEALLRRMYELTDEYKSKQAKEAKKKEEEEKKTKKEVES